MKKTWPLYALAALALACTNEAKPRLESTKDPEPPAAVGTVCDGVAAGTLASKPQGLPANMGMLVGEWLANKEHGRDNTNTTWRVLEACRKAGWDGNS